MSKKKNVKRYKFDPSGYEAPDGEYISGIHNEEIANSVGKLTTLWPHIEERMTWVFYQLTHVKDEQAARQIFRSIVSQQVRIRLMRHMLQKLPLNEQRSSEYDDIIEKYADINEKRNNYVHSMCYTHHSGRTFIAEKLDEFGLEMKWREISKQELTETTRSMSELSQQIIRLWLSERERESQ